ncbi:MAG TPA: hypothetical protein VD973_11705 [Symbiobacteriaceae bacterium]|nr:hypothetical protein [Symbiobacteriaceae bacterium]
MMGIPAVVLLVLMLSGCSKVSGVGRLAPHQVTETVPVVACKPDDRLFQNLDRAAKITLPVSTLIMKYETLPAPTIAEFVRETGAEPTAASVQGRVAGGETWRFKVEGESANLRIWRDHHLAVEANGSVSFLEFWFPRGPLKEEPELNEVLAQLRESFQGFRVGGARVTVSQPVPGPEEFTVWSGPIPVKEAVANYKESMAQDCASWSNRTVSVYRDGQFEQTPSTELNVGNGIRLAFAKDRFITESIKSGFSEVRVYDIPGIEFVSLGNSARPLVRREIPRGSSAHVGDRAGVGVGAHRRRRGRWAISCTRSAARLGPE